VTWQRLVPDFVAKQGQPWSKVLDYPVYNASNQINNLKYRRDYNDR
jgi:hypothetical protein